MTSVEVFDAYHRFADALGRAPDRAPFPMHYVTNADDGPYFVVMSSHRAEPDALAGTRTFERACELADERETRARRIKSAGRTRP
jgi:hypothetical protein